MGSHASDTSEKQGQGQGGESEAIGSIPGQSSGDQRHAVYPVCQQRLPGLRALSWFLSSSTPTQGVACRVSSGVDKDCLFAPSTTSFPAPPHTHTC